MHPVIPLLLLLCLVPLCSGISLGAPKRGENLLVNPSFEQAAEGLAASWSPVGAGYTLVYEGAQEGRSCFLCESDKPDHSAGAMQEIVFDTPIKHPFKVSGWSKSENALGPDYCLYMDCWYEDGTNLWGQRMNFQSGTHGWQYIEYVFNPAKPITKIQYFILFRHCTGRAWFDNVSICLAPFKIESERLISSLYGSNTIEYFARLSLPAKWTASVLRGKEEVFTTGGKGTAVEFSWPGTDQAGKELPGGTYTVRVAAEDDLLGEELMHETPTQTRMGPGRRYIAWVESSMNRVLVSDLPDDPTRALRAEIALAGNEYESFQVVLRAAPGQELKNCTVSVNDLKDGQGHTISARNVKWHQVGFVLMEELSRHPALPDAAPGWWPDPLLPVSKFDLPGGVTQSVWFTVYAPPKTPAGIYSGEVVIRPEGTAEVRVPVRARVYGFDLPIQSHLKTAFALMDGFLEKIYGPLTPELRQAYGDYVLERRLNPDDISRTDPPAIEDLEHYAKRGLNAFNIINMVEPRGERTWVCYSDPKVYTPEFKAYLIRRLDPYVEELRKRGLLDKAYVYTFDERGKEFYPIIKEYFGMIKERYGIPTLTTAKVPQDPEVMRELNIDWNCPVSSTYNFEQAEKCRAAGLQVWSYVCMGPRFPFANWLADDPLVEARVIWWQAYHQKMDGFLYWGLNIWSRKNNDYIIDPERDGPRLKWSITTGGDWPRLHGDGEMLYPGKDGPFGCIRLDNIRDGLEDYEYLWMLAELEGNVEKARAACEPVTTGLTTFTRDPKTVYATRDRIARRIEALLRQRR